MYSAKHIGSMEDLELYLLNSPDLVEEFLQLTRHLMGLAKQMEEVPDRRFWLGEANAYSSETLSRWAREFIAKRVYAFLRKGLEKIIEENLALIPVDRSVPADVALGILQFVPLPEEFHRCLAQIETPQETRDETLHETLLEPPDEQQDVPSFDEKAAKRVLPDSHKVSEIEKSKPEQKSVEKDAKTLEQMKRELEEEKRRSKKEIETSWKKLKAIEISKTSLPKGADDWFLKLRASSPYRFPEVIKGVLIRYQDKQEKYSLMCVKNTVLQYGKLVGDISTLYVCINYGKKKRDKILQKLSQITDNKAVNQNIRQYLLYHMETGLAQHAQNFRRQVEKCSSRQELLRLMTRYPLWDTSTFEDVPSLEIICKVKSICDKALCGEDIGKLFSRYLGIGEANMQRHLFRMLIAGSMHEKLQNEVGDIVNINQLLKKLKELKKSPETRHAADTLFQLIVTFLRRRSLVSFQCLKISLNFLPAHLQRKILMPIERKARKDLETQIQKLLLSKNRPGKKWKKLLQLLQNSKFHSLDIPVLGYSPSVWLEKLRAVDSADGDISKVVHHIFSDGRAPHCLLELIIEIHNVRFHPKRKSIRSCLRELTELKKELQSGTLLCLKRPLMDLFQSYGQINFSRPSTEETTGYQLARIIGKYYLNPARTAIVIPDNIQENIAEILTSSIHEERIRQLKKLG